MCLNDPTILPEFAHEPEPEIPPMLEDPVFMSDPTPLAVPPSNRWRRFWDWLSRTTPHSQALTPDEWKKRKPN